MVTIRSLMEWAVWAHLSDVKHKELLLLKGHLLIEGVLDTVLINEKPKEYEYYSFYKKIQLYSELDFNNKSDHEIIVSLLYRLNALRNRLAHDWNFDINNSQLESWVNDVHKNFKGEKFSKYTDRIKAAHSFSVLTKTILKLEENSER